MIVFYKLSQNHLKLCYNEKKEESMGHLRKIGSIFFAFMITICVIGATAIHQFQIVVNENHIEESLYDADYETLFQMIHLEQGTLLDQINSLIETRPWIKASTEDILKTDFVSTLVKIVIENQKEQKLDHRLSKAELLSLFTEHSMTIERDFQISWNDQSKEAILNQMTEDTYQLVEEVPDEVYQIVVDSSDINILLGENISWMMLLITGVFIAGLWMLNFNRNFFLYLMVPVGSTLLYSILFTQLFQFAITSATTPQLAFAVDLLDPYIDEAVSWTGQVGWISFGIMLGIGIAYLLCILLQKKKEMLSK